MMTATTGRPSNGRKTTRSRAKLKTIIAMIARGMAIHSGTLAASMPAQMKPASITNSPWAKLIASVAL